MSIRKYEDTGSATAIDELAQTTLVPILKGSPGFISYSILDLGPGSVASVSIFETREQALAANEATRGVVTKSFQELLPYPPTITVGEVISHTGK